MPDDILEQFDASDPVAENNASRDQARIERENADVLRMIMHTRQGRAWLLRQLDSCAINSPAKFVAGQPDTTAHNLGREAYGASLLQAVLGASVDLYMTAIKEQQEEARRVGEVRRSERIRREAAEPTAPVSQEFVSDLPPPAGFPGAPVAPKPVKRKGR